MASADGTQRLRLLPAFEFAVGGETQALPVRAQRLLVLLALARHPLPRTTIAHRLWPEAGASHAHASLRSTLWGFAQTPSSPLLIDGISLSLSDEVSVDLHEATVLAGVMIGGGLSYVPSLAEENLLRHDLLGDWPSGDDAALQVEQAQFRQLRLHALDALCAAHARAGRFARAVATGISAVAADPMRESAHRSLIRAHLAEGNRAAAIQQFHSYLSLVRQELGIGASPQLQDLLADALHDAQHRGDALQQGGDGRLTAG